VIVVGERAPVTVAELVAAVRHQQAAITDQGPQLEPSKVTRSTLVVIAAHAGAGASVVAVAIADAASHRATPAEPVHLVDLAPPEQSGMASAAECQIGSPYVGWLAARRGAMTMWRLTDPPASSTSVPALPEVEGGTLVLDPGRPWSDLIGLSNPIWELARQQQVVVVCRATVPGVRRAELALAALDRHVTVAAIGARRWPREVEASFGRRLAEVVDSGRAVLIPTERSVELNGVDAEPLPKSVATAAARLAELIWHTDPAREQRRVKGQH
jgi:hypothetical protein